MPVLRDHVIEKRLTFCSDLHSSSDLEEFTRERTSPTTSAPAQVWLETEWAGQNWDESWWR